MFDLDIAIYNSIKNTINYWSTTYGLFDFMKILVITSISTTALTNFVKIKHGDKNVSNGKR